MHNSIENRSPYLDKNLLTFARGLENDKLINSNFQKRILRDLSKKFLPKSIYEDKKKVGFNASLESLININGNELKDFLFSDKNSFLYEIININELKQLLKMKKLPNYLSKFLFSIISTQYFKKLKLDENSLEGINFNKTNVWLQQELQVLLDQICNFLKKSKNYL